jgi:predicted nucleic-acid-binding Zn-ribbon protein
MTDPKHCPKCGGAMQAGSLQTIGNYGNSPFVFAPEGEPPFPVAGKPSARLDVIAHRCTGCGYLEWYAPSAS